MSQWAYFTPFERVVYTLALAVLWPVSAVKRWRREQRWRKEARLARAEVREWRRG